MAAKKRIPSPLAIAALLLLAAAIVYIAILAFGQFTPKYADNAHCPGLIELILRAITVFFAGLMVLAGAGWWVVFNILPYFRRRTDRDEQSST